MATLSRDDLDFPTKYTEAVKIYKKDYNDAVEDSPNRFGPAEGALQTVGGATGAVAGQLVAGGLGNTVGRALGRGAGRATGMAVDLAGLVAALGSKAAAVAALEALGFEIDPAPPRRPRARKARIDESRMLPPPRGDAPLSGGGRVYIRTKGASRRGRRTDL